MSVSTYALTESCTNTGIVKEKTLTKMINAIPAREQWNANNGFCGETSLISAGLYYGQYVSQYDARLLANANFSTKARQILIGDFGDTGINNNITLAAKNMHLSYLQFNNVPHNQHSSIEFLTWVKQMLIKEYPTIIGVYENESVFEQDDPDSEYDHIVPVFGIESKRFVNQYFPNDILYFHDNGLFTGRGYSPQGCYRYSMSEFQKSREAADSPTAGIYSLSNNSNKKGNFGVAITGVKGNLLLPVRIQTNPTYEIPEIKEGSYVRPHPLLLTLTILVSNVQPNTSYTLLKYTNFNQLPPNDDFSTSYGKPTRKCNIWINAGNTFTKEEQIYSKEMAIYRAVKTKEGSPGLPSC